MANQRFLASGGLCIYEINALPSMIRHRAHRSSMIAVISILDCCTGLLCLSNGLNVSVAGMSGQDA
jgi:hypothetical protein